MKRKTESFIQSKYMKKNGFMTMGLILRELAISRNRDDAIFNFLVKIEGKCYYDVVLVEPSKLFV